MNKKLIIAAIAAAFAVPMAANAGAVMYGKVRVATQYANRDSSAPTGEVDSWGMTDQSSRLGVKGDEDLGGGLKAVYKMEFGVNVGGGTGTNDPDWTRRNMYVGVAGDFGTFLMGRHDTPLKMSTMDLDFFADTNVDNDDENSFANPALIPGADNIVGTADDGAYPYTTRGAGLFDGRRVNGAIAYVSPSFNGLTFMGALVQHAAGSNFDSHGTGSIAEEQFAGAYSLAVVYKNGPWYASAAYESISWEDLTGARVGVQDYDKWRLGIGMLNFNNFSISAIYESRTDAVDDIDPNATSPITRRSFDSDSWQISAAYDLMGMRIKGMYGQLDDDRIGIRPDPEAMDVWAIGLEQNLSKRTDIQLLYREKSLDNAFGAGRDLKDNVFALQLDHSF